MDNDPRSIHPPIRYSRGDRLRPCRNRDAEILPYRESRPARATRISGLNSIGMSTGLGKLRARIKRLGYGQWVRLPTIPTECEQSYHMFYFILPSPDRRRRLIWICRNAKPSPSIFRRMSRLWVSGLVATKATVPGRKIWPIACCVFHFSTECEWRKPWRRTSTGRYMSATIRFTALCTNGLRSSGARHCFHKWL